MSLGSSGDNFFVFSVTQRQLFCLLRVPETTFLSLVSPGDNFFVSRRQLACVQETTCFCRRQLLYAPETTFLSLLRPRDNLGDLTFVRQVSISNQDGVQPGGEDDLRFPQPDSRGWFCLRRQTTKIFEQNINRPKSRLAVRGLIIKSDLPFLIATTLRRPATTLRQHCHDVY